MRLPAAFFSGCVRGGSPKRDPFVRMESRFTSCTEPNPGLLVQPWNRSTGARLSLRRFGRPTCRNTSPTDDRKRVDVQSWTEFPRIPSFKALLIVCRHDRQSGNGDTYS